jgi:hypothetical protein
MACGPAIDRTGSMSVVLCHMGRNAQRLHPFDKASGIIQLVSARGLDLTPLDRQLEKPVSSREGELAWLQTRNVRSMIGSLRSML